MANRIWECWQICSVLEASFFRASFVSRADAITYRESLVDGSHDAFVVLVCPHSTCRDFVVYTCDADAAMEHVVDRCRYCARAEVCDDAR